MLMTPLLNVIAKKMYTTGQSNDRRKSSVLRSQRKTVKETVVPTELGRLFHALGATTGKARSLRNARRLGGTRSAELSADR